MIFVAGLIAALQLEVAGIRSRTSSIMNRTLPLMLMVVGQVEADWSDDEKYSQLDTVEAGGTWWGVGLLGSLLHG